MYNKGKSGQGLTLTWNLHHMRYSIKLNVLEMLSSLMSGKYSPFFKSFLYIIYVPIISFFFICFNLHFLMNCSVSITKFCRLLKYNSKHHLLPYLSHPHTWQTDGMSYLCLLYLQRFFQPILLKKMLTTTFLH